MNNVRKNLKVFLNYIKQPVIAYIHETKEIVSMNEEAIRFMGVEDKYINLELYKTSENKNFWMKLFEYNSAFAYDVKISYANSFRTVNAYFNFFESDNRHIILMFFTTSEKKIYGNRTAERIINHSNFVAVRWSDPKEWKVEYISKNISLFGYTSLQFHEELITWKDIVHSEDYERINEEFNQALNNNQNNITRIYKIITEAGYSVWVKDFLFIRKDKYTNKVKVEAVIIDISYELKENEEKYMLEGMVNRSDVVAMLYNFNPSDKPIKYISSNIEMYGYNRREFLTGKLKLEDLIHPEDRQRKNEEMKCLIESNIDKFTQEYRIMSKDGEVYWIKDSTTILRNEYEEKIHLESLLTNITEFKKLESKLRDNKEALQEKLDYIMEIPSTDGKKYNFSDFLDIKQLQEIQEIFTDLSQLYSVVMDNKNVPRTMVTGPIERIGEFYDIVEIKEFLQACEDFKNSKVENGMPNMKILEFRKIKVAGFPIRMGDITIATWVIFAGEDYDVRKFVSVARALFILLNSLSTFSYNNAKIRLDYEKSKSIQSKTSEMLEESRFYIDMLTLLQDNKGDNQVILKIMEKIGNYLHLSRIIISEYNRKTKELSGIYDWNESGLGTNLDALQRIPYEAIKYFREKMGDNCFASIDGGDIPYELIKALYMFNAKAVIVVEVNKNTKFSYLLIFIESNTNRKWTQNNIEIAKDAGKLVANELIRNKSMNVVINAKKAFETVLDNLDCYIFVQDDADGNILYVNKKLQDFCNGFQNSECCWKFIQSKKETYSSCQLRSMINNVGIKTVFYNECLDKWLCSKVEPVVWMDGNNAKIVTIYETNENS